MSLPPDLFSERADGYAAYRPGYPPELVDFLASIAPATRRAWDGGCGSGQLTVRLAERFEHVIGTDASEAQLARATPHERVEYRRARVEASRLPDRSVDLAAAGQAAHWFDLDAYYEEVRRVARPGAVVALVTYLLPTVAPTVDSALRTFYSDVLGPHWAPERRHVGEGYRSLPFPFDEVELPAMEIRIERTLDEFVGYVETWSAVRALERAEGRGAIDAFRSEMARAWGGGTRRVRWPLAGRVGYV